MVDTKFAKSANGILMLFTIVASALIIGLLGDGQAVDIRKGFGAFLLAACCIVLILICIYYAALLFKKITDFRLELILLFVCALLNIVALVVCGIYTGRWTKIQVVLTLQELTSAALVVLILLRLGFIHN